jgi:hypothetical protein
MSWLSFRNRRPDRSEGLVDGQIEDSAFGEIENAQAQRLLQLALKFSF